MASAIKKKKNGPLGQGMLTADPFLGPSISESWVKKSLESPAHLVNVQQSVLKAEVSPIHEPHPGSQKEFGLVQTLS